MLPWLGWIVAALLLGYLVGTRAWPRRATLRQRTAAITAYRGRSCGELTCLLGGPPQDVEWLPDGQRLCTWRGKGCSITLLIDAQDMCLGVHDEQG